MPTASRILGPAALPPPAESVEAALQADVDVISAMAATAARQVMSRAFNEHLDGSVRNPGGGWGVGRSSLNRKVPGTCAA
jgi:hypothetical protein